MKDKHVNQSTKIVVLPSVVRAMYAAEETKTIRNTILENLLLKSMESYHKVQVSVKHRSDGSPEALIAYMHRSFTYTLDVARVNIGTDYSASSVDLSYVDEGEMVVPVATPSRPIPITIPLLRTRMVFATPVPEIPTAGAAVEYLYKMATALGYKCRKLVGASANLANYKKYLSGHLWVVVNIGHGNTQGIALADGFLSYTWFEGLPNQALHPEVVYFNSCQVFNAPLQPAVMAAGARTFVGGKVNLLIGPSEEVCKCFWTKVLKQAAPMGTALTTCEKAKYPTTGSHWISGSVGKFKPIPS